MPQKNLLPPILAGAALMLVSTYISLTMGMTALLLMPPLIGCLLGMTAGPLAALGASALSGLSLLLFLDPLSAAAYALAGGFFGLFVCGLGLRTERIDVIIVLMGTYLSSLYMAYLAVLKDLTGVDMLLVMEEQFVNVYAAELAPLGINASQLFSQLSSLSFAGVFALGGFLAIWSLYLGARLAFSRGYQALVPSFLGFRMRELTMFPILALFGAGYLLTWAGGADFWLFTSNLLFILLFLFSLQGLSVIAWWRAARGKQNRFFYLLAVLLYLVPMGQISLGLLGFFENMMQIRKIGG